MLNSRLFVKVTPLYTTNPPSLIEQINYNTAHHIPMIPCIFPTITPRLQSKNMFFRHSPTVRLITVFHIIYESLRRQLFQLNQLSYKTPTAIHSPYLDNFLTVRALAERARTVVRALASQLFNIILTLQERRHKVRESLKDVRLSDEEDEEMEEDKPKKSKLPAKEPVNVTVENYSSSLNSILALLCSSLSLALRLTHPFL